MDGDRLPEPLFTPATKAELGDHDENVSYETVVATVGETTAVTLRDLTLAVYARAEGIARERGIILADTKIELGSRPDGTVVLGRRGAHPGLIAVLAGRRVGAGPRPAVVRQADRAQLGALAGVRLGPRLRRAPAPAARRGRRAHPGALPGGLRAAHRRVLVSAVRFPVPRAVAYDYLVEPENRPEWQSSLRGVADVSGPVAVGLWWTDVTKPGLRPRMELTVHDPPRRWTETGTWRGFDAVLTLDFVAVDGDTACDVTPTMRLRSRGLAGPVGAVLNRTAPLAVRSDLKRAARILGQPSSASYAAGLESRRNSEQRSHSSVSPMARAETASSARQRRKPRFGSCSHGTGPWPFQPLRRSMSSERW